MLEISLFIICMAVAAGLVVYHGYTIFEYGVIPAMPLGMCSMAASLLALVSVWPRYGEPMAAYVSNLITPYFGGWHEGGATMLMSVLFAILLFWFCWALPSKIAQSRHAAFKKLNP